MGKRVVVVGTGAVGARAVRHIEASGVADELVLVARNITRAQKLADSLQSNAEVETWRRELLDGADVVLLCNGTDQRRVAEYALERGVAVVSSSDSLSDVRALLGLHDEARERKLPVIVGAAFAPGLSCLLALHGAKDFEVIDEIHVAKFGTGGPACARQHHHALASSSTDWRDGAWRTRRGGSGRELVWFPDPVGGQDCYRAETPDSVLLQPHFEGIDRITARFAATRRDRLTSRMPMLRLPHLEGIVGAIRVELRGVELEKAQRSEIGMSPENSVVELDIHSRSRSGHLHGGPAVNKRISGARLTKTYGVLERPAVAAGAIAGLCVINLISDNANRESLNAGGVAGLAGRISNPAAFLSNLATAGVYAAVLEGAPH